MKAVKKMLVDPALIGLIVLNVYLIYEFKDDPKKYTSIIWLYWIQSVLIGVMNFFELLTTSNVASADFKMNNEDVDPKKSRGCYSLFFLVHYQGFHFAYFIFILVYFKLQHVDFHFLKLSFLAVLVSQVILFIQHKITYTAHAPKLSSMFFQPYLRIIPMHAMIILPAFLKWDTAITFLILKAVFDILGHLITTPYYWKKEKELSENIPAPTGV